jgi:DNA polymerase elongation subunit (family B)
MVDYSKLYGALTNLYFRFYDLRMGESTTGTGRMILQHQCRKVGEILDGNYNFDIPMYETVKDAQEAGHSADVALHGPKFNGEFQSPSVVYGDTDSCYFATGATNIEDAIKIADDVAAQVNASYQAFMQETFLCNPGFDDIIKCGREIVSDRGIFVGKKLYILHVADVEGKAVDKMKVMGLSIKKTTIPKHVSDRLEGFIEQLLKGKDWNELAQDVVDYKDEIKSTVNVADIGLPKGCNGIEEYTKDISIYGDDTRVPGHVRAAIYFNMLIDRYNDKVTPKIMSGTKIKVFYLTKKEGKYKSIALPTDIEQVPEWFKQDIVPFIDTDAQIDRLIDKPLENILSAIGKRPPTKQSILVDSLLVF